MSEISRSFRDIQPAHFLLKIESFSAFCSEPEFENFESDGFEAGGYKWRLRIYPKGDEKRNGKNHISLYLVISDTEGLPPGWEVNALITFFVFDHLRDNYLTIQDGKISRFHTMKSTSGFAQLISLDEFNNPSSGFLVDDCCAIGAEVFVIKHKGKEQRLTLIKDAQRNPYTWKIYDFSSIKEASLYSPKFTVEECKWKLLLHPKGNAESEEAKGKCLSLYLAVADHATLPPNWKIYATFNLRMRNQVSKNHIEKKTSCWFNASIPDWGFTQFLRVSDLNDKSQGYLVNDTIVIEAEISILGVNKIFS